MRHAIWYYLMSVVIVWLLTITGSSDAFAISVAILLGFFFSKSRD